MIKDVKIHRMDKHLFVGAVTSLAQSPRTPILDNFRGADDATGNPWRAQSAKVTHRRRRHIRPTQPRNLVHPIRAGRISIVNRIAAEIGIDI
jgi:hypothetical protein